MCSNCVCRVIKSVDTCAPPNVFKYERKLVEICAQITATYLKYKGQPIPESIMEGLTWSIDRRGLRTTLLSSLLLMLQVVAYIGQVRWRGHLVRMRGVPNAMQWKLSILTTDLLTRFLQSPDHASCALTTNHLQMAVDPISSSRITRDASMMTDASKSDPKE